MASLKRLRALRPAHRAGRFFGALRPGPPPAPEWAWALSQLSPSEQRLLLKMRNPDRRHAVEVARRVQAQLAVSADGASAGDLDDGASDGSAESTDHAWIITAALLHDVGKVASGLRTYGRVVATLCGVFGGRDLAEIWQRGSGITRRVGMYLRYGDIGAEMLELAQSDPRVVAWSMEHHGAPESWAVPRAAGELLVAADR